MFFDAEGEIRTPEPLRDEALNLTPLSTRRPPHALFLFIKRKPAIKEKILKFYFFGNAFFLNKCL